MRGKRSLLLVLASLAALAVLPARGLAATNGEPTLLGFTDDLGRVARAAPAVQGVSQVARIPIYWTGVEASGWGEVDAAVDAARASGQRLLLTVTGFQAPDLGEWAAFLTELRIRYPDVWGVQAWNEPNLASIGGNLSIEQVAGVVDVARQVLPGVHIVGPSVSPTVPGAAAYQTALYAALPDDVGVGVNLFTYRGNTGVADVVADYRKAEADGGNARVYVTEVGFHGAYFDDQALNSGRTFGVLRREGAATVIFYRLLANRFATANWELSGNFNVLNDDLSETPILTALRNAVVDTAAPKVKLKRAAVDRRKRTAKIKFSAKDNVARGKQVGFACALDKQEPEDCSSPAKFKRLRAGKHALKVTAIDAAGNQATAVERFRLKPR